MKNLQLSLIGKWFEMTKAGIKTEDYREITPYWCNILLVYKGKNKPIKWWNYVFMEEGNLFTIKSIQDDILIGHISFKEKDKNKMTLGYPKKTDSDKIINLKHDGFILAVVIMNGALNQMNYTL